MPRRSVCTDAMTKQAILILAGTESMSDLGRTVNGLETAKEFSEAGDDIKVVFDGAATQWIGELENEDHDYHELYASVREHVGVCDYCAGAFQVDEAVNESGLTRLSEYDGHPSIRSLREEGYDVITF